MTDPAIPVHIYMVLDRSGSMSQIATDVIGGFNHFIADQQAKPGKCRLTLVQFDDQAPFEIVHNAVKIADVPELTADSFRPRGSTPLLDAEGRTITAAEERAARRAGGNKSAEAILFVTYTDGLENASRDWTFATLTEKKKACEAAGWAFMYLGVGHDAYDQSQRMGTQSTVSASANTVGVGQTYAIYGDVATKVRKRAARGQTTNSADLFKDDDEE